MQTNDHLEASELKAAAAGRALSARGWRHLAHCAECRETLHLTAALMDVRTRRAGRPGCPPAESLVFLADGFELGPAERLELVRHADTCPECHEEIDALRESRFRSGTAPGAARRPLARQLAGLVARLRELVSFEMPPSLALATRGAAGTASNWTRGMELYRRGRYPEAARLLERARAEAAHEPAIAFFHGACLLHGDDALGAVNALRVAAKAQPRLGDYRWYLAQALLKAGDGPAALRELRKAASLAGPNRERAKTLGQQVAALVVD